jgi:hypothetical protein
LFKPSSLNHGIIQSSISIAFLIGAILWDPFSQRRQAVFRDETRTYASLFKIFTSKLKYKNSISSRVEFQASKLNYNHNRDLGNSDKTAKINNDNNIACTWKGDR